MADVPSRLHVKINSPEKIIWEGDAMSVSSSNARGPFDVLALHANFVTLIEKQTIYINTGTEVKEFTWDHCVLYCHKNNLSIFTNL